MPVESVPGTFGKSDSNRLLSIVCLGPSFQRPGSRNIVVGALLGHPGSLSRAIIPDGGSGGAGVRGGGPRGDVVSLVSSRADGRRPDGLCGEAVVSHTISPLPPLLAVVGRLYAALSCRIRRSSRRFRYRKRQNIPARAARAVPTMDTTMAMMICASENCWLSCWRCRSACA